MGSVFQLVPSGNGDWTENILHNFPDFSGDGDDLNGGLAASASGNLFGATTNGGTQGYGTVFELIPGFDSWTEQVLYTFSCCTQGHNPYAGPILGSDGNLYGTTSGAVFQMTPGSGFWNYNVLYLFCSLPNCADGGGAFAGVIRDSAGHLFGTTEGGGLYKVGTVYEVAQLGDRSWQEQVLHNYPSAQYDGQKPGVGQLSFDHSGNLYGTTNQGGRNICGNAGCGTVFKLTKPRGSSSGQWTEAILSNFKTGTTGFGPGAGVIFDASGNLYGTTLYGGSSGCGCGVVYRLTPQSTGKWQYTVLHTFVGTDGAQPDANLTLGPDGNLYGTAATGGPAGQGVVFEILLPRATAH